MCQSWVDFDKRIHRLQDLLRSTTEPVEIERIRNVITQLYAERVRLHKINSDKRWISNSKPLLFDSQGGPVGPTLIPSPTAALPGVGAETVW